MNARNQLAFDIQKALNWASIDAKANTPDYELAAQMVDAPSLRGYLKASASPVETGECGMAEQSAEDRRRQLERRQDQADLIDLILSYRNPASDEARMRQIRVVME